MLSEKLSRVSLLNNSSLSRLEFGSEKSAFGICVLFGTSTVLTLRLTLPRRSVIVYTWEALDFFLFKMCANCCRPTSYENVVAIFVETYLFRFPLMPVTQKIPKFRRRLRYGVAYFKAGGATA